MVFKWIWSYMQMQHGLKLWEWCVTLYISLALTWSGASLRTCWKCVKALSTLSSLYRHKPRTYIASALMLSSLRMSLATSWASPYRPRNARHSARDILSCLDADEIARARSRQKSDCKIFRKRVYYNKTSILYRGLISIGFNVVIEIDIPFCSL